jgi:hypothetical protein
MGSSRILERVVRNRIIIARLRCRGSKVDKWLKCGR